MKANTFRFDGDAALALKVHRVEHLLGHLARRKRAGEFEQTIGKRGLAMINVRDDAEISYELGIHATVLNKDSPQESFSGAPECFSLP
jgi:hypothetical protein